jgi:hypothetical protein
VTFDQDPGPVHNMAQLIQRASATTGFTPAEIVSLVDCELETNYVLDYITAVISKRMN